MAGTVITVCSTKGGVGKTTLVANLGGILADMGQRVLLIDSDVQPSLSRHYPITRQAASGLTKLLVDGDIETTISQTSVGCDLVVSDDPNGKLHAWILNTPDGRFRLRRATKQLVQKYDIILIDTQGAVGPLQDNAVLAGQILVSPIPPEILSAREFATGTLEMLDRLRPMEDMGCAIGHLYGVINRMNRTLDAKAIATELRHQCSQSSRPSITILNTEIPNFVAYTEAASAGIPVHIYEPVRRGRTPSARETMRSHAAELMPHLANQTLISDQLAESA